MKKYFRLISNDDFSNVIKNGRTLKNASFVVHYLASSNNNLRIGITASTKLGNAVVRSTTRRRVRALCDELISNWEAKIDIVIIAKFEFLNKSYNDNRSLLNEIISSIPELKK